MDRGCDLSRWEPELTDAPVCVVQFPHPGAEHWFGDGDRMPWNADGHARKFLRSAGRAIDESGRDRHGRFVFWGEWEAPSHIIERWPAEGRLPQLLHSPTWERPPTADYRQNTDPWVFGETFRYSNCKQLTYRHNPSALQELTPGSVIFFGSKLDGEFVLDTVFVVKDSVPYSPNQPPVTDEAFRICTMESLVTDDCGDFPFTLYRGATLDDSIEGMYSYSPCRDAAAAAARFARPAIYLPGFINPASAQSPSGAREPRTIEQAVEQWQSVREQVFLAGCELGVSFETPRPHG